MPDLRLPAYVGASVGALSCVVAPVLLLGEFGFTAPGLLSAAGVQVLTATPTAACVFFARREALGAAESRA